jgi:DNA-binding transcriptional LysR family regulator
MIKIKRKSSRKTALEINDLVLLWHIVERGSFGRGGAVMGFSQPKVTRRVKVIENHFGTQVLFRNARGVALTRNGEHVLEMARSIVEHVEAMKTHAHDDQSTMQGEISIISTPGLIWQWLTDLLVSFQKEHPGVSFKVLTNDSGDGNLMMGEADIAISSTPPAEQEHTESRILGAYSMHMYASASYLEKKGMPRCFADLDHHDLVVWCGSASIPTQHNDLLLCAGKNKGDKPRTPKIRIANDSSLMAALTCSAGISLIPDFIGQPCGLIKIPFFDALPDDAVQHAKYVTWISKANTFPRHKTFLEALKAKAEADPTMTHVWSALSPRQKRVPRQG